MGRVAGPVKASLDKICMEKPQVPPDNEYRACVNTSTRVKMVWAPGWGLSLEEDTKGGGMLGEQQGAWHQQGAWQWRRPSSSAPTVGLCDLRLVKFCLPFSRT